MTGPDPRERLWPLCKLSMCVGLCPTAIVILASLLGFGDDLDVNVC